MSQGQSTSLAVTAIQIVKTVKDQTDYAEKNRLCKRKGVWSGVFKLLKSGALLPISHGVNGPLKGHECTNEVGNCGCAHSEFRALRGVAEIEAHLRTHLILMCSYSPCTFCANTIIDSGLISAVVYGTRTEHDLRGLQFLERHMKVVSVEELENWMNTPNMGYAKVKETPLDFFKEWIQAM